MNECPWIGLGNWHPKYSRRLCLVLALRVEGRSRKSAFYYGAMSAIVESIAAVLGAYAVMSMTQLLPYALLFAAGA